MGPPRLPLERPCPADPDRGKADRVRRLARPEAAGDRTAPEAGRPVRNGVRHPAGGRDDRAWDRRRPGAGGRRPERRTRRPHENSEDQGEDPMTRLPPRSFAALAAGAVLAMAGVSPAAAQTPAPAAAPATAQPTHRSVAVEGGAIQYQVIGDLTGGKTPVLV